MKSSARLPRIFVGSSAESLPVAYAIQENLDFDAEVTVWSQNFFTPSSNALADIVRKAASFDFALFVFAADDIVRMRGVQHAAARDNVVFELGVFFGTLGIQRCFIVMPRGADSPRLPSDLLGLMPLTYNSGRSDGSLVAALGATCNQVRHAIRALRNFEKSSVEASRYSEAPYSVISADDFVRLWDSNELTHARADIRSFPTDFRGEEFQNLRPSFDKVVAFLESMSDAVLAGVVDEDKMFTSFGHSVVSLWPWVMQTRVPSGHADPADAVEPMPKLGQLFSRWKVRHAND